MDVLGQRLPHGDLAPAGQSVIPQTDPGAALKPWQFLAYELRLDLNGANLERRVSADHRLADSGIGITTLARQRDRPI